MQSRRAHGPASRAAGDSSHTARDTVAQGGSLPEAVLRLVAEPGENPAHHGPPREEGPQQLGEGSRPRLGHLVFRSGHF